jgi:ribosomal-protein-alanine N-acetyltransferase
MKVEIRLHKLSDAKRFYEILTDKEFQKYGKRIGMNMGVNSVKEEEKFLKQSIINTKRGYTYGYAIIVDKKVAGGIDIKINQHRKYIGEIGYFLDKNLWKKGIVTEALNQMSELGLKKYRLKRLEVVINPINKASIRVAEKSGYEYEGIMKNAILSKDGRLIKGVLLSKCK